MAASILDLADDTLFVVIDICDLIVDMWSLIAFTSWLFVGDAMVYLNLKIKFADLPGPSVFI